MAIYFNCDENDPTTSMKNNIVKISYIDAHYSFEPTSIPPRGKIVSYGRVVSQTKDYIDLEQAWTEKPKRTIFGVIIPTGVITGTRRSHNKISKDTYRGGDIIAVYWSDIFQYDHKYKGPHTPASLLTEGTISKETNAYILINNPVTLDLRHSRNHPAKKIRTYYIPKAMITEIRLVKKHDNK